MRIRNNRGLTLVETLVSAIIGAIIAGIILAILGMQGSVLNEGTANAKSLRQVNTAEDIVATMVRPANLLLAGDEYDQWSKTPSGFTQRSVATVLAFDSAGVLTGGLKTGGTCLLETDDNQDWDTVKIGQEAISTSTASPFVLSADRKHLSLYMDIQTTYRTKTYTMPVRGVMFQCRN